MNRDDLRTTLIETIVDIAPDLTPEEVTDHANLRDDYDLDSMDSFNLATEIHKTLGVNIPEADFAKLQTLGELVTYLEPRLT